MKLLNTLLAALLITLLPSLGWSTPLDELVERDGLYYPKFSEIPFTGKITGLTQGYLKNGKEEGDWLGYHRNGQLDFKGNYKNGKKDGDWLEYRSNGQLRSKGNFINGSREGVWVYYWDNGQLISETIEEICEGEKSSKDY